MMHFLFSIALLALQATTPAVPPAQAPSDPPAQMSLAVPGAAYLIGPNDVLAVRVLGETELTREYTVDSDGTITFPFLNRVPVMGKTVAEIENLLASMLREGFINNAQVSVGITTYRSRSIYVMGEVKNPARYNIEGQTTLLDVIATAGSFTANAGPTIILSRYKEGMTGIPAGMPVVPGDPRAAEVMRLAVDDLRQGKLQANVILQDGDTIYVPAADKFFVSGFVRTPGQYVLTPGLTVRQALTLAGGITERGSDRGMVIIRKVQGKEVEVGVNMSTIVQAGDTIRIRQRRI